MFCTKCGAKLEEATSFCTKCGTPVNNQPVVATPKKNVMGDIFKNKFIWAIAGAVVLLILTIIIVILQPKKINVADFIEISYSGYDEYATARAYLDEEGLYSAILAAKGTKKVDFDKLGGLEALLNKKRMSNYYELLKCIDSINLEVSPSNNLSNGDSITVNISYDNKLVKKQKIRFTGKKVSETVVGLEAVTKIDPFKDLTVGFKGISPNGYIEYYYEGDNSYVSTYSFNLDSGDSLRNGDIVTISIDYTDEDTLYYGYVFTEKEKQYVVEGLEEYVEQYADLASDFLENLKTDAKDTIYAYTANSYNKETSLGELSYSGYIFNTGKQESGYYNNYNEIYIIYSGFVSHSEGKFSTTKVYFPIRYSNILKNGDDIYYGEKSDVIGGSNFNNSWSYYTNGYINPLICYMELVESKRNDYVTECGDGFEDYAEYKAISALSEISEDFSNKLANDAKDRIESYVANNYSEGSQIEGLTLKGEYLLVAKSQGTDFVNNNKYIMVYTGTLKNDQGKFETTVVYFPIEYDGIVSLPKDEYLVTEYKGILGNTYIGNSWYTTYGYTDGEEMYKKLITANRDLYTYEVTEGLKEFGE